MTEVLIIGIWVSGAYDITFRAQDSCSTVVTPYRRN